ncbi:hypothetical protein [Shewanella dokdonensis]|uniref:Bacteriocin n=1 Tax=Shewanella dokdonensis TaxID=712036 RepID=A0ABX8DBR6_9GAMM|nr:hypothetical protein [Shewanella dokdonensis]MCL1074751.1 hypothetical protein [Shewanella dokdonensis]QVK22268.1 hypothetical protein KHX94_12680 [Shewanella dokdonensis]
MELLTSEDLNCVSGGEINAENTISFMGAVSALGGAFAKSAAAPALAVAAAFTSGYWLGSAMNQMATK